MELGLAQVGTGKARVFSGVYLKQEETGPASLRP